MKNSIFYNTKTIEEEEVEVLTEETALFNIVLYNDDYNTFDHVIECLIKYCKHEEAQAEQCSLIVHYKGKCAVKHGEFIELVPIKEALADQGLNVTIEALV